MKLMKSRRSFFFKLLASYLLAGVLPVVILGIFATVFTYTLPIRKLENQSMQMAYKSLDSLEEMLRGYQNTLEIFARDEKVQEVLASESAGREDIKVIYQRMFTLLSGKVTDSDLYLIRANGDFLISAIPDNRAYDGKSKKGWGIFRELDENAHAFIYPNRYTTGDGKDIALSVVKRITVDDQTAGYAILDIPKSTVEKTLTVKGNLLDMNYMIMDDNFYIMYDDLLKDESRFFQLGFRMELLDSREDNRIVKIKDRSGLLCSLSSKEIPLILLAEVPVETILQNNKYIVVMTFLMLAVSIVFCCVLTLFTTRKVSKPIRDIVHTMEKVEKGEMEARVEVPEGNDEIAYMSRRFNEMVENLNDLYKKNMEKQDRLRLAEIKSLQAQINPHFLYNTLDSIKWLAKLNGVDAISVMVSKLGNLLKNTINSDGDLVTIEESMYLIDSYLSIQKIRFDDKFDVFVDIDDTLMQCLVPKLVIQPIVENAIVHGIENKIGKCNVRITGKREGDRIVIEVEDDGIGMSAETLEKLRDSVVAGSSGESIGLSNIHNRIKLYYGEKYGLEIDSVQGKGTRVRVTMPAHDGGLAAGGIA